MLELLYKQFSKANIASFASRVSAGAAAGDACCQRVMKKAGERLGRMLRALWVQADRSLVESGTVCLGVTRLGAWTVDC